MQDDDKKTSPELNEEEPNPKASTKQSIQIIDITDQLPDGYTVIMQLDDPDEKEEKVSN